MSVENWRVVASAISSLEREEVSIGDIVGSLKRIIEEGCWREFDAPMTGPVRHKTFAAFMAEPPRRGLGTDRETIERLVGPDHAILNMLDQALQGKNGRPPKPETLHNVQGSSAPTGNRAASALRRLRKDRPDLLARVIAEELSPHGAMVEAGFRHRTVSVPTGDVERAARALRRHFDEHELTLLIKVLSS